MTSRVVIASAVLLAVAGSFAAAETSRVILAQTTPQPTTVCPMIYKPVCGLDRSGKQRTYSNECMAKAAGATRITNGTCVSDITY